MSNSYKRSFRRRNKIKGGHIDHIIPVVAFMNYGIFDLDVINADDNLRGISAKENLSKSGFYDNLIVEKYLISKEIQFNAN